MASARWSPQGLQRDPLSGDVFLFVSRDRVRAKVLHFDGTGLCLYAKRLERGRFAALWRDEGDGPDHADRQRARSVSRWQRARRSRARSRRPRSRTFRLPRIARDDQMRGEWCSSRTNATSRRFGRSASSSIARISASSPRISQLTAELARLRGVPEVEQLDVHGRARAAADARADPRRRGRRRRAGAAARPAAGPRPARAAGVADRRGAARAAGGPARSVRPAAATLTEMVGPVRDGRAHHHGQAHVSGRAPCPAEVSLRVQRRGGHGARRRPR